MQKKIKELAFFKMLTFHWKIIEGSISYCRIMSKVRTTNMDVVRKFLLVIFMPCQVNHLSLASENYILSFYLIFFTHSTFFSDFFTRLNQHNTSSIGQSCVVHFKCLLWKLGGCSLVIATQGRSWDAYTEGFWSEAFPSLFHSNNNH